MRIQEENPSIYRKIPENLNLICYLKKKKSEFAGKLSFEENHVHIFNLKCEFGHLQLVLGRHLLAVHNQNHFGLVLHYRQVLPKWLLSGI